MSTCSAVRCVRRTELRRTRVCSPVWFVCRTFRASKWTCSAGRFGRRTELRSTLRSSAVRFVTRTQRRSMSACSPVRFHPDARGPLESRPVLARPPPSMPVRPEALVESGAAAKPRRPRRESQPPRRGARSWKLGAGPRARPPSRSLSDPPPRAPSVSEGAGLAIRGRPTSPPSLTLGAPTRRQRRRLHTVPRAPSPEPRAAPQSPERERGGRPRDPGSSDALPRSRSGLRRGVSDDVVPTR